MTRLEEIENQIKDLNSEALVIRTEMCKIHEEKYRKEIDILFSYLATRKWIFQYTLDSIHSEGDGLLYKGEYSLKEIMALIDIHQEHFDAITDISYTTPPYKYETEMNIYIAFRSIQSALDWITKLKLKIYAYKRSFDEKRTELEKLMELEKLVTFIE
jgi:hypothetical protein